MSPQRKWDNHTFDLWIQEHAMGFRRMSNVNGIDAPVLIQCSQGHVIQRSVYNFQKGKHKCSVCYQEERLWTNEKLDKYIHDNAQGYIRIGSVVDSRTPLEMKCPRGHVFNPNIGSFVHRSTRCRQCNDECKRYTNEQFDTYVREHAVGYTRICDVIRSTDRVEVRCPNGHVTTPFVNNFISGSRCVICYSESIQWTNRKFDDYITENATGFRRLSAVKNARTRVDLRCDHGHIFSVRLDAFVRGSRCWLCEIDGRRKPFNEVVKVFENAGCNLLSNEYINSQTPMPYICSCGQEAMTSLTNFVRGSRCFECSLEKRSAQFRYEYDYVYTYFKTNGCELLSTKYRNGHSSLQYICSCGNVSRISFNKFKNGNQRCKRCGILKISAENNYAWNPDLTQEDRDKGRNISGYSEWVYLVKERDDFTCQFCGDNRGGNLVSHHLEGYHHAKALRTDVNNGVTLCETCHTQFHQRYGYQHNNRAQFDEWMATEH